MENGRRLAAVLLVGLVAATLTVLRAQTPPTFRSGVQLLQVDAVVTDRSGNPVRNLTADDFEIFEDERPQQIEGFTAIDLPYTIRAVGRSALEPDIVTNTAPEGRTYVFLIDMAEMSADGIFAQHLLREFV